MKIKGIILFVFFILLLISLFAGDYGHGNIWVVQDTSYIVDKFAPRLYFCTTDSLYYFSTNGILQKVVMTTAEQVGDIIIYNSDSTWVVLHKGTEGQVLKMQDTNLPGWGSDNTVSGGSATADSAATNLGNKDFDDLLDNDKLLDTVAVAINISKWRSFSRNSFKMIVIDTSGIDFTTTDSTIHYFATFDNPTAEIFPKSEHSVFIKRLAVNSIVVGIPHFGWGDSVAYSIKIKEK